MAAAMPRFTPMLPDCALYQKAPAMQRSPVAPRRSCTRLPAGSAMSRKRSVWAATHSPSKELLSVP